MKAKSKKAKRRSKEIPPCNVMFMVRNCGDNAVLVIGRQGGARGAIHNSLHLEPGQTLTMPPMSSTTFSVRGVKRRPGLLW